MAGGKPCRMAGRAMLVCFCAVWLLAHGATAASYRGSSSFMAAHQEVPPEELAQAQDVAPAHAHVNELMELLRVGSHHSRTPLEDLRNIISDSLGEPHPLAGNLVRLAHTLEHADPAGLCSVHDLLASSDNVNMAGATAGVTHVKVGGSVTLTCKPGLQPAAGQKKVMQVTCTRSEEHNYAVWSGHLNCGKGCSNALLVSGTGQPDVVEGHTAPNGRVMMHCGDFMGAERRTSAQCQLNGHWKELEPCRLCDTSELLGWDTAMEASARGLLLPNSQVTLSCGQGTYAFPTIHAIATCRPGGTWYRPPFSCRAVGCDTGSLVDTVRDRLLPEEQGRLAVGTSVTVRSLTATDKGGVQPSSQSFTCMADGTWLLRDKPGMDLPDFSGPGGKQREWLSADGDKEQYDMQYYDA